MEWQWFKDIEVLTENRGSGYYGIVKYKDEGRIMPVQSDGRVVI